MIALGSATLSPRQRRVVDQALLAYVRWRAQCAAVDDSYRWWASATPEDNARAHAAYRSALDREEAAADAYAQLIKRATAALSTDGLQPRPREAPFDPTA